MRRLARAIVPQPWRLRLWLAFQHFTPGSLRLRKAQPSRRQKARARLELRRRAARHDAVGIDRLSGLRVINLRSQTQRLAATMVELDRLHIATAERFEAIEDPDGAVGCARSHLALVEQMLTNEWESMLVCEDDIQFLLGREQLDVLIDAFLDDPSADVACLAYFVWRSEPHSRLFLRGLSVQTTACYVLKRQIAEPLLATWRNGLGHLERGDRRYVCDRTWMSLQERDVFLIPIVRAARQRAGYSDVQRRVVGYRH